MHNILGILRNPRPGGLSTEPKKYIIDHMRSQSHSLAYTERQLELMRDEIGSTLSELGSWARKISPSDAVEAIGDVG